MSESLSYSVCNYWDKRILNVSTDFVVTGYMLCVIHHIRKGEIDHSDSDHRKQLKNLIKTLFHRLYEDKSNFTLYLFWTDYTDLDNKNGPIDGAEFICKIKYISDGNSHLWNQKYSLYCTKVLGFVVCVVTSKVLGIGRAGSS